jgi:hypothetical protein
MPLAIECRSRDLSRETVHLVQRAGDLLERHTHFQGRSKHFRYETDGDVLTVRGTVPSFYLKQLLQVALKGLGLRIDNQVTVACYIRPYPIDLDLADA